MVNRRPSVSAQIFAPSALARNGHHLILTWHMSYGKNISPQNAQDQRARGAQKGAFLEGDSRKGFLGQKGSGYKR